MLNLPLRTLVFSFAFLALLACRQESPKETSRGIVEANDAYLRNFGEPPEVESGKAFARVAYLPFKANPGTVSAVPIFLFDEHRQLEQVLGRLTDGALILPTDSVLFNPFNADTKLTIGSHQGTVLSLELELPENLNAATVIPSIAETAAQFDDVETVRIAINGQTVADMPEGGFRHDANRIADVAPPDLIMIAGMWHGAAEGPDEIMVNFDRPVTVNTFRLNHADGGRVAGEYFTAVFNMSVVIHPEAPGRFHEGLELNAEWDVTDARGRTGRGSGTFSLVKVVEKN